MLISYKTERNSSLTVKKKRIPRHIKAFLIPFVNKHFLVAKNRRIGSNHRSIYLASILLLTAA